MNIRVSRKPAHAYQHGNLREALVQAGLKLLGEGGVANLSLRAAAQLAGVSHAAPYRHFKDKDALVAAIAEQGFRLLTAAMREEVAALDRRAGAGAASVRERLVALGRGYFRFATRHPGYLQVIFGGVLAPELCPPELRAAGQEAYLELRNAVADGIARGELRQEDPEVLSLACWANIHGFSHLFVNRALDPAKGAPLAQAAAERLAERLVRLLGSGIASPPARDAGGA
jgi:AcrR family transcriptional regulator